MTPTLKEIQALPGLTEEEFMAGFEGEPFVPHKALKENPPVSAPARGGQLTGENQGANHG